MIPLSFYVGIPPFLDTPAILNRLYCCLAFYRQWNNHLILWLESELAFETYLSLMDSFHSDPCSLLLDRVFKLTSALPICFFRSDHIIAPSDGLRLGLLSIDGLESLSAGCTWFARLATFERRLLVVIFYKISIILCLLLLHDGFAPLAINLVASFIEVFEAIHSPGHGVRKLNSHLAHQSPWRAEFGRWFLLTSR